MAELSDMVTPALMLDEGRVRANIARLRGRLEALGVGFRPHVKTAKCLEVVRMLTAGGVTGLTVSTLREAEEMAAAGFHDLLYTVAVTPNKVARVRRLVETGVRLGVVVDHVAAAQALADAARTWNWPLDVWLEVDSDGHRAGLAPESPELAAVAAALAGERVRLRGVMTHAGESYSCRSAEALRAMAERERAAAVRVAERLAELGHSDLVVSVGSTPTAMFAEDLTGVTEVRAGVFVFMDLVMAGLGVCTPEEIAISVLTTVVGHQRDRGWTLVDAGWMALSRDRGTAAQAVDQGYGLVATEAGEVLPDYRVVAATQEHGIIQHRSGRPEDLLDLPFGSRLRILPNHACATSAAHDRYQVFTATGVRRGEWPIFRGW